MGLSNLLSVFVPTHIIRASTEPYIKNEMIVETILQAHEKLNLANVEFCIYPDAAFNDTHPELMKEYYAYLESIRSMPGFENININFFCCSFFIVINTIYNFKSIFIKRIFFTG